MAGDKGIEALLETSMDNLRKMINVNTVVGDAMHLGDGVCVVPISKVALGFGAGGGEYGNETGDDKPFGGGSGGGMSIQPVGFLVSNNGQVRFMPIAGESNPIDALIEAVPELVGTVAGLFSKKDKASAE